MILKLFLNTQMIWMIKNVEEYKPNKTHKILIVFDDMVADMLSNEKHDQVVTELFIRDIRKVNISLGFMTQSYFAATKIIRLNSTEFFILKIKKIIVLLGNALNQLSKLRTKSWVKMTQVECITPIVK